MYQPKALNEPAGSVAADLAQRAINGQLTIYAGAGLSAADPTYLPGAAGLAKRIADALEEQITLDGVDTDDLVAVADAVSAQPLGSDLLRQTILAVADFLGADFNYAHAVMALLLCEGVVTVIETNYDDCIERAAQPERPTVVATPAEMLDASGATLLKAHGCATQPRTMIVTTAELDDVPHWAQTRVASQLHSDRVVFVGIGSPADYVQNTIQDLLTEVGADHLLIVDPSVAAWDSKETSAWKAILPNIKAEQRDSRTAEDFLDALLRAYLHHPRRTARNAVSGMPDDHPQKRGLELILAAMEKRHAVWALRWIRAASTKHAPGVAIATSDQLIKGLLGTGSLLAESTISKLRSGGWILVNVDQSDAGESAMRPPDEQLTHVMLVMASGSVLGSEAEAEARHRVTRARGDDIVPSGADVVVVVVGHIGPMSGEAPVQRGDRLQDVLTREEATRPESPPGNLVSTPAQGHLIDGASSGSIVLINGENLIEAA
jgi:hypothetical protein